MSVVLRLHSNAITGLPGQPGRVVDSIIFAIPGDAIVGPQDRLCEYQLFLDSGAVHGKPLENTSANVLVSLHGATAKYRLIECTVPQFISGPPDGTEKWPGRVTLRYEVDSVPVERVGQNFVQEIEPNSVIPFSSELLREKLNTGDLLIEDQSLLRFPVKANSPGGSAVLLGIDSAENAGDGPAVENGELRAGQLMITWTKTWFPPVLSIIRDVSLAVAGALAVPLLRGRERRGLGTVWRVLALLPGVVLAAASLTWVRDASAGLWWMFGSLSFFGFVWILMAFRNRNVPSSSKQLTTKGSVPG